MAIFVITGQMTSRSQMPTQLKYTHIYILEFRVDLYPNIGKKREKNSELRDFIHFQNFDPNVGKKSRSKGFITCM